MSYISKAQTRVTTQYGIMGSGPNRKRDVLHQDIKNNDTESWKTPSVSYTTTEYPVNQLGGDRYPHYVMFFINENETSIKANNLTDAGEYATQLAWSRNPAQSISNTLKNGIENPKIVEAARSTIGGFVGTANNTVSQFVESSMKDFAELVDTGIGKVTSQLAQWTTPRKRISKAICLPMPQKIRANYGASYGATNEASPLGSVIMSMMRGEDASSTLVKAATPAVVGVATEFIKSKAGSTTADIIGGGMSPEMVAQIRDKLSGAVFNKRQEQLFKNMEFRKHHFSYVFVPRNQQESDAIKKIIYDFKYHMHPTLGSKDNGAGSSSLLVIPAEFDIEFRYRDAENKSISKIATCALESCDVNYTAVGEFIAFEGNDNPVAITLDLVFAEMEPLTRDMIERGF